MTAAVRAILAVSALVLAGTPAAFAQDAGPSAAVERDPVATGEELRITGAGWPAGTLVRVELCGNSALDATADCDIGGSRDVGITDDGSLYAVIPIEAPPSPCPCVIRVSGITAGAAVRVPVTVLGVPVAPPEQRVEVPSISRALEVTEAEVSGAGPWTSWLGAPAMRTLHLTIRNTGDVAILDPRLTVTVGRGDDPAGLVTAPDLGRIEAGETRSIEIPVELDVLAFGSYTVRARVGGAGEPVVARAATSTYPWVLLAGAVVLVQLGLLSIRNRVRARVVAAAPPTETLEVPATHVRTEGPIMFRSRKATSPPAPAQVVAADDLAAFVPEVPAPDVVPEPQHAAESVAATQRTQAAVVAGNYLQEAIEEARRLRTAAAEDRRLAAAALNEVQARCDALLAGAEQIVLERATEVRARNEEAVALLAEARRRADEMIFAATVTVEDARLAAERHRADATEMLARTAHLSDELLAEARARVEELLHGVERRATERLLEPTSVSVVEPEELLDLTQTAPEAVQSSSVSPLVASE